MVYQNDQKDEKNGFPTTLVKCRYVDKALSC